MKSRDSVYLAISLIFFAASIIVFTARSGCAARKTEESLLNVQTAPSKLTVDINSDDPEELMQLPGIGESTAEKILNYRKVHGDFSDIEDIMEVEGIKEKKFSQIKDYLYVGKGKKD